MGSANQFRINPFSISHTIRWGVCWLLAAQGHGAVAGSHIQWEMFGKVVNPDIDMQCRLLQREIDKAANVSETDCLCCQVPCKLIKPTC